MESTLTLSDAKARLSEIVKKAVNGEDFVVTRMGQPAVRITRYEPRCDLPKLGDLDGLIRIADDFDRLPADMEEVLGMVKPD